MPPPASLEKIPGALLTKLERLRLYLARCDALLPLCVLGVLTGLLAGGVIIAFRVVIETAQSALLPDGNPENFEALAHWQRFVLPTAGGLLIGLLLHWLGKAHRSLGVVHVIERLAYHQGQLPWRNALLQFVAAALSLISGHSVGREGPGVHLGAACGSQLGLVLQLPHDYLRTLVGCGVAAAIAASFNTPLAGVVFAMEVVLMEYTVAGFAPVILAAVAATSVVQWVYGAAPAFDVPALQLVSVSELPIVLAMGVMMGALAAAFIQVLRCCSAFRPEWPIWWRCTLGGMAVGACALWVPEVMGVGYDTVSGALLSQLSIATLLAVVVFKLLATAAAIGFGLPGGLIGPTFVMGAAAGGLTAALAALAFPETSASMAFYALLGMGAMMAATLQAPLAALMAMLELTANPNIILPGMLAVIAAVVTASKLFGTESVFLGVLHARGLDYRNDPVAQALRKIGVAKVMNTRIVLSQRVIEAQHAPTLLKDNPQWIVIAEDNQPNMLLRASDLARHNQELDAAETAEIDLSAIPAERLRLAPVDLRATLQEALDTLTASKAEALYVMQTTAPLITRTYGVLTPQDIEASYRQRPGY